MTEIKPIIYLFFSILVLLFSNSPNRSQPQWACLIYRKGHGFTFDIMEQAIPCYFSGQKAQWIYCIPGFKDDYNNFRFDKIVPAFLRIHSQSIAE